MTDVQNYTGPALVNPFERSDAMPAHVNAGTVMIEEQRAIAEVKGKLSVAKMFPRNEALAYQKVINACSRKAFAETATYAFPRGGKTVSGPSIRLAEVMAAAWGNIDYGMRELSRKDGVSEMEAYAWDLETNAISAQRFTVNHIRDKSEGGAKVSSERDIYELTANQASRRMRERIFAVIPADLIEAALRQCAQTIAGNSNEPIADRVRKMIGAFNKFGVTAQMLEKRLGRKLDAMLPDDIAEYTGIYNSIKDGLSSAGDWFGGEAPALSAPAAQEQPATANDNDAAKKPASRGRKAKAEEPKPEDKPAETQPQEPAQEAAQQAPADTKPEAQAEAPALTQPPQAAPAGNVGDVF